MPFSFSLPIGFVKRLIIRLRAVPHAVLATLVLALILLLISSLLSVPAGIYAWQRPTLLNYLSLAFTIGLFVAAGLLIRSRVLLVALGLIVLILNLIEIVSLVSFGGLISLGGVEALLYVDPHEAREFVVEHIAVIGLGLLIVPLFVGLVLLKGRVDRLRTTPRLLCAAAVTLLPASLFTAELVRTGSPDDIYLPTRVVEHYVAYLGANPLTSTISGIATAVAAQQEFEALRVTRANFRFTAAEPARAGRQLYVVVVGESSRRRNWSLYGYGRDTTPQLLAQSGLITFRNAISPATVTSLSLPQSFYFASQSREGQPQIAKSFISAFRAAGFKTFWLSNQGTHRSAVGNQIGVLMQEADMVRTTNYGFWNSVLDGALLAEFDRAVQDPAERKLVIVHTLGSHTIYGQRYPAEWRALPLHPPAHAVHTNTKLSPADAEAIDDYDRSIRYTDWLLNEFVSRMKQLDQYGAMVYFSDHGQRLIDDSSHVKGHGYSDFKPFDVEIPLIVWTSDRFAASNPDKIAAIIDNRCKRVSTVDLAASMLDLAAIKVSPIDPAPSFFAPHYQIGPRRVLLINHRLEPYDNDDRTVPTPGC